MERCSPSVDHLMMIALQRSPESAVHVPERFRAVAPSAALLKGLSPDSSYRDGGMIQKRNHDMKISALIYLLNAFKLQTARLAAGFFGWPPQFDQFRNDGVAMIALDLDNALAHSTARAASLL
jgi:hypothetical protein